MSLLTGWLPWTLLILGVVALLYLIIRTERWWWLIVVPVVVLVSAILAWVLGGPVSESIIGQPVPTSDRLWIAVIISGLLLMVGNFVRSTAVRGSVAVLCAILVFAGAGNEINKSFAQYPTLGDLVGDSGAVEIDAPPAINPSASFAALPEGPLTETWTPTGPNIPSDGLGRVSDITLSGTKSGFQARPGKVYLPPAYFADNPQPLPVLVLMAGQPGGPGDWLTGQRIQQVFDPFAAQHRGIAPVVVVVDQLGGDGLGNPMCFDSPLGNLDTYLSQDVPADIKSQLVVSPDPKHWAIGGFSNGGTCAFQMVTNHPEIYPSFIDIGGEVEPSNGSHQTTVQTAFGGDESKFKQVNPMDILARQKFTDVSGWFIYGSEDSIFGPGGPTLNNAALKAGMDTQLWVSPGTAHGWDTVSAGMDHVLPWLTKRMDLTS